MLSLLPLSILPTVFGALLLLGFVGDLVLGAVASASVGGDSGGGWGYNPQYKDDPGYPSDVYDTEFDPEFDGDDLSQQAARVKNQAAKKARRAKEQEKRTMTPSMTLILLSSQHLSLLPLMKTLFMTRILMSSPRNRSSD